MNRDSVLGTLLVATVLCVACSVVVSSAAVILRPRQLENKELDRSKNILIAAGLYDPQQPPSESVDAIYKSRVQTVLLDLETGKPVGDSGPDPQDYNPREAASKEELSTPVEPPDSLHGIRRREKYAFAYLVKDQGRLDQMVFPIYGKGLWSTLYGFLALDADTKSVRGITFYEHAETPGLGGEVDNPGWKAKWRDKQAFDEQWDVRVEVLKGQISGDTADPQYKIDGLSGATITTRGVSDLVQYWLGPEGFGPFLTRQRDEALASSLLKDSDG